MDRHAGRRDEFDALWMGEPNSGCWLWIGAEYVRGYGCFQQELAHRCAYEIYVGPIPDGLHVLHHCDTKACVNPNHLYAGTHQQNMWDARDRNRITPLRGDLHPRRLRPELNLKGEDHGRAILTEAEVLTIRRSREPIKSLASRYGVSSPTIEAIRYRRTWRHLP